MTTIMKSSRRKSAWVASGVILWVITLAVVGPEFIEASLVASVFLWGGWGVAMLVGIAR